MSNFYPCATELALKYHMNRNEPCRTCREWWARVQAGEAALAAPAAPSKRRVAQCGTPSGAKKHRREHTEMCQPCRDAENGKSRDWKANKNGTKGLGRPITNGCGTAAAASRHRKNDEPMDEACAKAEKEYNAERYQRASARKKAKAQQ